MKCGKCQFENPEKARFCVECGDELGVLCPSCGSHNSPAFKFCAECGQALTLPSKPSAKDLSFEEKLTKIQRYLPQGLTEKILSQRDRIEGERKRVTVMFCDMQGFTSLTDRLGPEETYAVMDRVYETLIHKVHQFEGTVNEMSGDGIVALFGAPIALEDAPQRAIRSAMAIHREMVKHSDKMQQEKEGMHSLEMRIGIHTGPVVVGTLGNDLRVEFKAVGDTVNLASRMEGLAEPGTTYVTEETFKLTEGLFRFEALGEKEVKGKEEPVNVYRVIAPSTRRTRFDVSAERGLTPFVGRGRELELLLDGFEKCKAGRGQVFSIVSEAGVGKTRLLYEFRRTVINEDVTFLEGKSLSYSRGVPYHPIIDMLKATFDIQEGDEHSRIREKARASLEGLGADEASTLPYLLELLQVKDSGIDRLSMTPEGMKVRIHEALKRIVLKGSEVRPLILAFEDLHWADKSSEESLADLRNSIPGARVLLIFTYRPEFMPTWPGKSFHNRLNLDRLSDPESLAMVTYLLDGADLDKSLKEFILEKTEGVAFFVEESIKTLKNLKIIEKRDGKYYLTKPIEDVTISSTIQDVIMARVDSLPDAAKEVLQVGSVIEREFGYELAKTVTSLPEEDLLSHLSILKDSELLYERGSYPHSTYIFKHALTQEVVYDSILNKRKKTLHEEIGSAIEDLYRENLDEHYGILTEHFIRSENHEKGADYLRLASQKAEEKSAFKEAISYSRKEVFCLERLPQTEAVQRKLIEARTDLGTHLTILNYHAEAKEAVDPIVDLALKLNCEERLPGIYLAMGGYFLEIEEDRSKGLQYFDKTLQISQKLGDFRSFFLANYFLASAFSLTCEFSKSLECYENCINISEAADNVTWMSFSKSTMANMNYVFQGKVHLAYQVAKDSLRMAEESGDAFVQGMAYSAYGGVCHYKGLFGEAEANLCKALSFFEKTSHVSWGPIASMMLGFTYTNTRRYKEAEHCFEKGISIWESLRYFPTFTNFLRIAKAMAKVFNYDQGVDLNKVFAYYSNVKYKLTKGWAARCIGEILLNIDDQHMSDAEDWIKKAIEEDKRNGTRWSLGHDYLVYGDFFERKGQQAKAKESLTKAIEILNECGADGFVKEAEKRLANHF